MSFVLLSLLCISILSLCSTNVNGFTTTTIQTIATATAATKLSSSIQVTTISKNSKQSQIQQQRQRHQVVLTSTSTTINDVAEMDGSGINGLSSSSPLFSSTSTIDNNTHAHTQTQKRRISKLSALITKIGMMAFIVSMCLSLPIALFPPYLLYKLQLISQIQQQQMALTAGQFCARWLLRIIPFSTVKCYSSPEQEINPQPCVWVCNHTSALDIFILLAKDKKLRGKNRRPIKIVYWKGLEDNPITKLLFTQCGFIPVQMAANSAGEDNKYDMKSFKTLLRMSKQAFKEGSDIGILPEGQLNPHPEEKLLPCFPGAFTLAKMSKRPVRFMALHGTHRLWHARDDIGMTVTGRDVALRVYPGEGRKLKSAEEFLATFEAVVGKFATTGEDLNNDELTAWLDGSKWNEQQHEIKTNGEDEK